MDYKDDAIRFHESWILKKDIPEIEILLQTKFDRLDMKKVREFKRYLEGL